MNLLMLKALPWKLIGLSALALAFVCLGVALKLERAHSAKLQSQLTALAQRSKEKQIEVREVIKQGKDRIITVQKQAQKIEQAPLPGNCRTPDAVMGADL